MKKPGALLVICGGSGVGKDTVTGIIIGKSDFKRLPTYTTRAMRPGEIEGQQYHFISEEKYTELDKAGKLIDKKQVSDRRYAIPMEETKSAIENGAKGLMIITVEGAEIIKKILPETILVAIIPPYSEDMLIERLKKRGVSDEEIKKRLVDNPTPTNLDFFDFVITNEEGQAEKTADAILDFVNAR